MMKKEETKKTKMMIMMMIMIMKKRKKKKTTKIIIIMMMMKKKKKTKKMMMMMMMKKRKKRRRRRRRRQWQQLELHDIEIASLCKVSCQVKHSAQSRNYTVPLQAMKAYSGRRRTAPLILKLGTRWRSVVNFTPRPLYPRERKPVPTKLDAVWAPDLVWTFCKREKSLATTGIRTPDPPTGSEVAIPTTLPRLLKSPQNLQFLNSKINYFSLKWLFVRSDKCAPISRNESDILTVMSQTN